MTKASGERKLEMAALNKLDLVVIILYMAGIVGMGVWLSRKSGKTEEFMAAGRSLPGWAVGLSIFGTYVSSISFLANPGRSFGSNWNPYVFGLSLPIAAWLAVKFFVPFYRKGSSLTAYEHFEERFGLWARMYADACYLLTQLARVGTILYLVALALAPLTGWDIRFIILLTGVLVTVYTILGGIEAVIWTDVIQSIVLTFGAILCAVILLAGMPEGPGQLFSIAAEHDKFSLGSYGFSLTESTFWVVLLYGLFINLQNFGIDQSYVQRYFTARSDGDARKSVWLGALLYLPISALLFFVGTALFAYYTAQPDLLPESIDPISSPDSVFPWFIANGLPAGLTGLLIAAVMAAAMSSVDSSLNSSATLIHTDIYKRLLNRNATEKQSMRVLYGATLVFGVLGTGMALLMINAKSALDTWWQLAGIFSGGMLGLFLMGMISRATNWKAALGGVTGGVILIFWMSLSPLPVWPDTLSGFRNPLHSYMTIVLGTTTILLLGLILSQVFRRKEQDK